MQSAENIRCLQYVSVSGFLCEGIENERAQLSDAKNQLSSGRSLLKNARAELDRKEHDYQLCSQVDDYELEQQRKWIKKYS